MPLSEKSSAPSRWEYIFDFILLGLFIVPLCLFAATGTLCTQTAGLGSPFVCTIPAFEPVAKLIELMVVINFIFGGFLLTFPLLLISYIGSTIQKIRQWRRCGLKQAFAQYRFGFIVWMVATGIVPVLILVSLTAFLLGAAWG